MGALLFILLIYIAWTNHRTIRLLKNEKGILSRAFGKFLDVYRETHTRRDKEDVTG
jgi:hypothetical protein